MTVPSLPGAGPTITGLTNPVKKDSPEKIKEAASQFEALMIGQILKAAHGDSDEGAFGGDVDPASASAMDFANEYFARSLASTGGLGLSKMIVEGLTRQSATHSSPATTPEPSGSIPTSDR